MPNSDDTVSPAFDDQQVRELITSETIEEIFNKLSKLIPNSESREAWLKEWQPILGKLKSKIIEALQNK